MLMPAQDPAGMMRGTLERLRESDRPIVVGPWLTEVGYELLYWIPFVAWAQQAYQLDPARFVVVSRGGCQSWYAHLASRYFDVFQWVTPKEFRKANQARVALPGKRKTGKQMDIGLFDRQILAKVERAIGPHELLHPSLMYRLFRITRPWNPEWQKFAKHQPFLPVAPLDGLPEKYVAVRCYTSSICPDSPATRGHLTDMVRDLLMDVDVVLLNTGEQFDDHHEIRFDGLTHPRLHRIADRLTPETNLDVQTRVIAGASSVVGTYGGYSYLPPLLGVDAETVYVDPVSMARLDHHLTVARDVFRSSAKYGRLGLSLLGAPRAEYQVA